MNPRGGAASRFPIFLRSAVQKLAGMDNPKTMPQLAELGKLSAERNVQQDHLPEAFRIP